jgi:hypothetical protein
MGARINVRRAPESSSTGKEGWDCWGAVHWYRSRNSSLGSIHRLRDWGERLRLLKGNPPLFANGVEHFESQFQGPRGAAWAPESTYAERRKGRNHYVEELSGARRTLILAPMLHHEGLGTAIRSVSPQSLNLCILPRELFRDRYQCTAPQQSHPSLPMELNWVPGG